MTRPLCSYAALLLACSLSTIGRAQQPADLVLLGGKVVTMDDRQPQAEALAARGDRIVAVGTRREIEPYVGSDTEVIELDGRLSSPASSTAMRTSSAWARRWQAWIFRRPATGRKSCSLSPKQLVVRLKASGLSAAAGTRRNGTRRRSRMSKVIPYMTL